MTSGHSALAKHQEHQQVEPVPMATLLIVCFIHTQGISEQVVFFFFIVMKTRSFSPTYVIKLFTTSVKFACLKILFHYHICYEYSKIASLCFLKMQYPSVLFSYENLNFYCNCSIFSIFKIPMGMGC